jgi:hypothetical protein
MAGADMIQVSAFVRHGSVWITVTPTMEQVVRAANSMQESLGRAVPSRSDSQRNALIAETAFLLAGAGFPETHIRKSELEAKARDFIMRLPRSEGSEASLSSDEWAEVGMLAQVTQRYFSRLDQPTFSPKIPGCGVVDAATGDILCGTELVEIKTVTRQFRALDIRQALTYSAMLYASNYTVDRITLLNPRRARFMSMSLDEIATATRGESKVSLLQDLVQSMVGLQVSA